MTQPVKTLIFIENKNAIQSILREISQKTEDNYDIIALTPHVEYELEKRGVSYKRPEDYFNEQIYETIGERNTKRTETLCSYLDDYLQKKNKLLRTHNIQTATFNLFYLKILFDAVYIPLYSVKTILNKDKPDLIIFESTQREPIADRLYWLQESVYSRVIEFVCRENGFHYKCFTVQNNSDTKKRDGNEQIIGKATLKTKKVFNKVFNLLQDIDGWKAKITFLTKIAGIQKGQRRYLFLSFSGNMKYIILRMLSSLSYDVWIWQEGRLMHSLKEMIYSRRRHLLNSNFEQMDELKQYLESSARAIKKDETFRAFFIDDNTDWFPLVKDRIEHFIIQVPNKTVQVYFQAISLLDAIRPKALILESIAGYRPKAIAHAAKKQRIPVVTLHHGDVGTHYDPSYYYHDIVSTDYYFSYGEGVKSYLNKNYPKAVKSVVVGSPVLDQMQYHFIGKEDLCARFGLDKKKKIIIYVLTGLRGKHEYFNHNKPSDSHYYEINQRIVSIFRPFDDIQLIVKGQRPSKINCQSPVEDYIRDTGKTNWKVISDFPFNRLVSLADAFIIDSPATMLLEAMVTDVPIYIFNKSFLWEPGVLEILQRRAYVYNDLDEFCRVVKHDLEDGSIFEKRKTDDTFLRAFGIPYRDGRSTERFLEALKMIS